jgi:hypothetical protein
MVERPIVLRALMLLAALALWLPSAACDRGKEPSTAEKAVAAAARGLDRARKERTLNRLENLRNALTRYGIDHDGAVPEGSSLAAIDGELSPRYLPMLEAQDAWGTTMTCSSDGRAYSIVSAGPDTVFGTADDIVLSDGSIKDGQ